MTNFKNTLHLLYVAANTDRPRLTCSQYVTLESALSEEERMIWDDYVGTVQARGLSSLWSHREETTSAHVRLSRAALALEEAYGAVAYTSLFAPGAAVERGIST